MSDFFKKDENYSIPSTSGYMRFEEGENRFRILGSFAEGTAIMGMEYWKTIDGKRKPIRVKPGVSVPVSELEMNTFGELDRPRYFWALPVWNYQEKRVQILEITQKTILSYIKKQAENPKWGDPREYDFTVTRGKENGKTVYTVTNDPKEELPSEIMEQYLAMSINLNALYEGKDPFEAQTDKETEEMNEEVHQALG